MLGSGGTKGHGMDTCAAEPTDLMHTLSYTQVWLVGIS